MEHNKIQKTIEETCSGLVRSKENTCFKNPGTTYCKAPVRPNKNPADSKINPATMNLFSNGLLFNASISIDCKTAGIRFTRSVYILKESDDVTFFFFG